MRVTKKMLLEKIARLEAFNVMPIVIVRSWGAEELIQDRVGFVPLCRYAVGVARATEFGMCNGKRYVYLAKGQLEI